MGGHKELLEKLGRNDPCPCGSGRRFQTLLHAQRRARRLGSRLLLSGSRLALLPCVFGTRRGTIAAAKLRPLDGMEPRILAAAEALVGLLIEISFIATFTQRFFGSK